MRVTPLFLLRELIGLAGGSPLRRAAAAAVLAPMALSISGIPAPTPADVAMQWWGGFGILYGALLWLARLAGVALDDAFWHCLNGDNR